ncbi:hypothetical protein LBMAG20_14020 [Methylocystaceae bacterium]|nr:hypothetical protein LBMAG20_14020 [Methylocystaceae bacterium]
MDMDKISKTLLVVLAAGLWLNFIVMLLKPNPALAEQDLLSSLVKNYSGSTVSDFNIIKKAILSIADGTCTNKKLCGPSQ